MLDKIFINESLPITIQNDGLTYDEGIFSMSKISEFRTKSLRRYYLNAVTVFPKVVYRSYWIDDSFKHFEKSGLKMKLTVVYPDIIGIEYSKTKTIKSTDGVRIIEGFQGQGIVITQPDASPRLDSFVPHIINMSPGQKAVVPAGWYYTLVNISSEPFAVIEIMKREQPTNLILEGMRGAPIYFIERNGAVEIVKNSQYKNVQKYVTLDTDEYSRKLQIQPERSAARQLHENGSQFSWFHRHADHNWDETFVSCIIGDPFSFID